MGVLRKAFTTAGSNWVPEQRIISAMASFTGMEDRYGRSDVMASKESATARILAPRGISSAAHFLVQAVAVIAIMVVFDNLDYFLVDQRLNDAGADDAMR